MSQTNGSRKATHFSESNDRRTVIALQSHVFEDICCYLEKKCAPQMKYYVALRTTVPAAKEGTLFGKLRRKPCNLTEEKDLPNDYWADVLVLPVTSRATQEQSCGKALILPILTVKRSKWGIGSRTVYEHRDCHDELERLTSLSMQVGDSDEASTLYRGCSKLRVVEKEIPCACS